MRTYTSTKKAKGFLLMYGEAVLFKHRENRGLARKKLEKWDTTQINNHIPY